MCLLERDSGRKPFESGTTRHLIHCKHCARLSRLSDVIPGQTPTTTRSLECYSLLIEAKDCGPVAVYVCFLTCGMRRLWQRRVCCCLCMCTPLWLYGGFAATLLCENLSLDRPAVSGGAHGPPVRSQQTHKAK